MQRAELRARDYAGGGELELAPAELSSIGALGYTGEDGFELITTNNQAVALWQKLLALGQALGLVPAGLGARDTLRTEAGYSLYGHELTSETTPIEAGLGWAVADHKIGFIGKDTFAAQKQDGVSRRCVGFKMTGKSAPPREQYKIFAADGTSREIGEVTSGMQSPSLGYGIGLGYVESAHAKSGTDIEIEIRNRRFLALKAVLDNQHPAPHLLMKRHSAMAGLRRGR